MNYRPEVRVIVDGIEIDTHNIAPVCRLVVGIENAERKLARFVSLQLQYSRGLDPFER